ncbi:MAG TPA: hypothetical protein VES69_00620 [Pyrinomonadaceae bacterium]|nr:hypothetical protein [Pyrinomonadaceae bacterium]
MRRQSEATTALEIEHAEQAYQYGLVNQVTDPADVLTAAESLAKDISKLSLHSRFVPA